MARSPTEKQIAYLIDLGYSGEMPTTLMQASVAIDAMKSGRGKAGAQRAILAQRRREKGKQYGCGSLIFAAVLFWLGYAVVMPMLNPPPKPLPVQQPVIQPDPIVEPAAPEKQSEPFREWSNKSGKFKVEARFVRQSGGKVTIEKRDGKQTMVEIEKLNEADQGYLKTMDVTPE